MIDGATRVLVIVGDPIEHARSPIVVNAALRRSGVNAVLVPWHTPPARFNRVMQGLLNTANLAGIVVTYPFKQQALALANTVRSAGQRVGAINALRPETDGSWTGDMFDGIGLVRAVEGMGRQIPGAKVKILGAGGAGSAIAFALAEAGAAEVAIFDVDGARAATLAQGVSRAVTGCRAIASDDRLSGADLLINATPIGLSAEDGLPAGLADLSAATAVVDIVPRQAGTKLLAFALERGCPAIGGVAMVEGQAAVLLEFFGLGTQAGKGSQA